MADGSIRRSLSRDENISDYAPASEAISDHFNDLVNARDLEEIIESQNSLMTRFEKSNEVLMRVNALSAVRFEAMNLSYKKHIVMLTDMKKNLDIIFKRIRTLKQVIHSKHPEAYEACKKDYAPSDEENDGGTEQ